MIIPATRPTKQPMMNVMMGMTASLDGVPDESAAHREGVGLAVQPI
jgi:hypothetical protein